MAIQTEISSDGSEMIMHISGRFDFSQHQEFRDACKKIAPSVSRVSLNLAQTDYVDSSALGMMLLLRDKFEGQKEKVRILNVKPDVRKILEIANFTQLFALVS